MAEDLKIPSYPDLHEFSPEMQRAPLERSMLGAMQAATSLDWAIVVLKNKLVQLRDTPVAGSLQNAIMLVEISRDEQATLAAKCWQALEKLK